MGETPAGHYQVGRGIADITGEVAECGMLGYGKASQQADGIQLRLRSRAFLVIDDERRRRVLLVVNELPLMFESVHAAVLRGLEARYGAWYSAQNVMLTVTHTHCGPGGYAHHRLYNLTTGGFRPATFVAIVDGILLAVERAHVDCAPATLRLAHGSLRDASTNRSRSAFDLDPPAERAWFPDAVDPQTTLLSIERGGRAVGAITWFATHGTSMTNRNTLVSGDNKGYAAYHWERLVHGVDYRAESPPSFVAAFAQTNSGDMSPNLGHLLGRGPTDSDVENTRIVGLRQVTAAMSLLDAPAEPLSGDVDSRFSYLDLSRCRVSPGSAGDSRAHRTGRPVGGASAIAGTDEGRGFPGFRQGRNPVWDGLSRLVYRISPGLRDAQAPKGMVLPGGLLNRLAPFVAERVPVQLVRIGSLYLVGIPGEVTIVAGLRLRRAVAAVVGAEVRDVLVAGYSNGYIHYVTTPEEYAAQRYEGGSTLFGRWELAALQDAVEALARAMRDGTAVPNEPATPSPSAARPARLPRRRRRSITDRPLAGHAFGDVLSDATGPYRPGDTVTVDYVGAHPANDLRSGGTFLEVQRRGSYGAWTTIADDGDWSTTFRWTRVGRAGSHVTITWVVGEQDEGSYRICYRGTARVDGSLLDVVAESAAFDVTSDP